MTFEMVSTVLSGRRKRRRGHRDNQRYRGQGGHQCATERVVGTRDPFW
jgi:hypothetical protein